MASSHLLCTAIKHDFDARKCSTYNPVSLLHVLHIEEGLHERVGSLEIFQLEVKSMAVKGVDISCWNAGTNYALLKQSGIEFAIIRTGYGNDYPGQQDKLLEQHIAGCEAAGIAWGVYHYSYARDRKDGIEEANHCLRLLKGRKPAYGVWYDMEDNSTLGGDLAGAAEGFCSTVESHGLYVGVYASLSWFMRHLTAPVFDKYDRWVAQYNSVCQYKKPYGIWQRSSSLVIGGVTFDENVAYKDYPALTGKTATVQKPETEDGASRVLATQKNGITRPFGNGHIGIDLGWRTIQNDGILAHSQGTVVFCQTGYGNNQGSVGNASYGNCVKLLHPNGYYTLYAHLSEVNVVDGQDVAKGQQIGRMGNTGNSYGAHLHFEVRDPKNVCIDPAPYIAADLPGLATNQIGMEDDDMTEVQVKEICKQVIADSRKALQDNDCGKWSQEARDWAVSTGLIAGSGEAMPDGTPNYMWGDQLSREQAAALFYRFAKMMGKA